jgi:hypothetical protein
MEFSEYENIEIFNKTQRFDINKYENQIIRQYEEKTICDSKASIFSIYDFLVLDVSKNNYIFENCFNNNRIIMNL